MIMFGLCREIGHRLVTSGGYGRQRITRCAQCGIITDESE